jgi:hypothetical protein
MLPHILPYFFILSQLVSELFSSCFYCFIDLVLTFPIKEMEALKLAKIVNPSMNQNSQRVGSDISKICDIRCYFDRPSVL